MKEKVFIGVAWPYANGSLHLGHLAGCYLPADIFARFCRMNGKDVLMVSGSDEHGTPITITAEKEGVSPKEIADRFHKEHSENMEQLGISFDLFTRTSGDFHKKVVKEVVKKLYEKGFIYERETEAFYCENCKRFLPDRYIEGICPYCKYGHARGDQCDECGKLLEPRDLIDPKCKVCGGVPTPRKTKHLFFALSRFENRLLEWIKDKHHWRSNVKKFTENWIKGGLKDRAITRDINWGVEVPIEGFEDKRIYVWFDAVIGYLSASMEWAEKTGKPEKWKEWWKNKDVKHYYFLAKDNIPFHTIIWPSILMGYDESLNLPYDIPANEYLKLEGEQFSKSRGLAIWIPDVLKKFDVDPIRYYLSINMPEHRDSNWRWDDFVSKNNDELVGIYGNLVHRILTFSWKHFGRVPPAREMDEMDKDLLKSIEKTLNNARKELERCSFKKALREILSLAQKGNAYLAYKKPWEIIKTDREKCETTMHVCLRLAKALAILLAPFLPFSSEKVWRYLGYNDSIFLHSWEEALDDIEDGMELVKPEPLFRKLSLEEIAPEDPFSYLDIRVAKVMKVKDHPNADRLYIIEVDVGEKGKRILVAGIKKFYRKEELEGKNVLILTNLRRAKFRGVESEGMLLAADDGKVVSLLIADAEPGEVAGIDGIDHIPKDVIDVEDFKKVKMVVDERGKVVYNGKALMVNGKPVRLDRKVEKGAKIF
ncbi:MAG: methionine--tRNA ligase [Thermoplasmata archaeon]|nr:MAG: methionine--tRNA ligase [Thermoplasmata archaeon]RLF39652.1 MAG: methionine--tRNA ligase [Thermoplasmata archaeon]